MTHALLQHRTTIEDRVSTDLGRAWNVSDVVDLGDRASHPAALITDGRFRVFAKLGQGPNALLQMQTEVENLCAMTDLAGVLTPRVIAAAPVPGGALMIMEAVEEVPRQARHWRQYGRALARLHRNHAPRFGLDRDGYWGDLRISNAWSDRWPEFFWTRRVEPGLEAAVESGHLPANLSRSLRALHERLDALCGPPVPPTLIHGDAHQNNVLATEAGAVLIDPALCYGHPEFDLANVDFFQPVSDELFRGYEELATIDVGFPNRRELWRLPFHLAMVQVEGPDWLGGLEAALERLG